MLYSLLRSKPQYRHQYETRDAKKGGRGGPYHVSIWLLTLFNSYAGGTQVKVEKNPYHWVIVTDEIDVAVDVFVVVLVTVLVLVVVTVTEGLQSG